MGGQTEALATALKRDYTAGQSLPDALAVAVNVLASVGGPDGKPRELPATQLEVAVLDRTRGARKFRRITGAALTPLLPAPAPPPSPSEPPTATARIPPRSRRN